MHTEKYQMLAISVHKLNDYLFHQLTENGCPLQGNTFTFTYLYLITYVSHELNNPTAQVQTQLVDQFIK